MILHKTLPESLVQRAHARFQFGQHPACQLGVLFLILLDPVKNGRLDVGDDQAVEVIEKTALDDLSSQRQPFLFAEAAALKLIEQKGRDHLVRLLVHLVQFHGAQLVVPASHAGSGKHELQQAFSQGLHDASA